MPDGPGAVQLPRARQGMVRGDTGQKLGFAAFVLITLWLLVLFDPQWLLASYGLRPLLRLPTLLFLILVITLAVQVPSNPAWSRRWQWHPMLLAFIATGMVTLPWAQNNGYARQSLQLYLLYWTLTVATIVIADSARRAEKLLLMYGLAFLWYALWGVRSGGIAWHYSLFNYDGFGAIMVIGVGVCTFLFLGARKGTHFRRAMGVASALCIVGVVSSFARGAFLAAIGVGIVVWLRSPSKGKALLWAAGASVLVVAAAEIVHPGKFWAEMQSVFDEGTTSGTGQDRWVLWDAAIKVFKERPLFGVGPRNFGPFAAQFFQPGDLLEGGYGYTRNPRMLYGRSLHSIYFQILAEHGIAGSLAFIGILVHFWKINGRLRTPAAEQRWHAIGGELRLRSVALGLEAGMVGYLITAAVYAMLAVHWFYTIIALNLLLHALVISDLQLKHGARQNARSSRPLLAPIRGSGLARSPGS